MLVPIIIKLALKQGRVLIRGHDGQLRVTLLKKWTAFEPRRLEMGHIIKRHVGASVFLSFFLSAGTERRNEG